MTAPAYIHLRLHSEFSVVDGIVRIESKDQTDAPSRAAAMQMPALALTDLMNVFGMVKFYKGMRGKGLKPIIGVDCWLENESDRDKPFRVLLLCKNRTGYHRICQLLTAAYLNNQVRGRAELKRAWLAEGDNSGLIALSGAHLGDVGQALLAGNHESAARLAQEWAAWFPGDFYLELQRINQHQVSACVDQTVLLAAHLGLPVVATHPIEFLHPDDFKAHEARVCIAEGYTLTDKRRPKNFSEDQYFKTPDEMAELFADLPEALANSVEIARRCNLTVQLGKNFLPDFPTPDGMSLDAFLAQRAQEGLEARLLRLYPDQAERDAQRPAYLERLKFETDTIIAMGFPGYFLIVADFINWAKQNGVPVGPGRGSGAGSLVAYSLGITDLDPTRYALLFERFLNPERVSMPDFDIDFCQDNRWRVIEYVRETYGAAAVSQIVTFGTMAARAVIRDVGRVLDLGYNFCDQISKLIPAQPGKQVSLDEAIELEPLLKERVEHEEEVRQLFDLARRLEGLTRNVGMHAGGVLIAPGQLTDFCPLYQGVGDDASPVSQFDKDDVEQIGLVKFDFLGLRNLTIIDLALRYIRDMDPTVEIDFERMGFDDQAAYQVLREANTTAIFQVESEGMKRLLEKLGPDRFEDIIAVLALYRPGPLGSGMVDDFVLRKKGRQEIDYFHPDLKACLEPTYGVIVYQEQVMQISQIIGGYTLGGADMLRRAMGKKKPEEMAKHRETIAAGARARGYDPALAEQLFDLMTKFAEYGFNKSHTAAYAVVTYQTAWLKAHHTAAFMAATMSSELDNTDQLKIFYEDCVKKNRLTFLPPDVNESSYRFVPVGREHIRYALGAIKGTGEAAVEHLVQEREARGPFQDLFDFCHRTDKRVVNRRVVEALIRAGAFDALQPNRAELLANVGVAMEAAEQAAANINQGSLFDLMDPDDAPGAQMTPTPPWDEKEQLDQEKQALGFYFSGHPFRAYRKELSPFLRTQLGRLTAGRDPVLIAGIIGAVRTQMTRRGKMAFVTLDDGESQLEVSVFNEMFDENRGKLKEDRLLLVEGKVSEDTFNGGLKVVAHALYDLTEARSQRAKKLHLTLTHQTAPGAQGLSPVAHLLELLKPWRHGACPVIVNYQGRDARCSLELDTPWKVQLDDGLIVSLQRWLTPDAVSVEY